MTDPMGLASYQRWWSDNWTARATELAGWLEQSDVGSRHAVFGFVDAQDAASVLEVGPGLLIDYRMHWQHRPNLQYEVLDVTPHVLVLAAEHGITRHRGGVEAIPLPDRAFDVVYTRHVLEHCPHYDTPIREMVRVARRGVAVALFLHKDTGTDEIACGTYDGFPDVYHNTYARDGITALFDQLGWDTQWVLTDNDAVACATPRAAVGAPGKRKASRGARA
jgi:ubiquinone/menaquinone biosynthesis C-methylase UbiE